MSPCRHQIIKRRQNKGTFRYQGMRQDNFGPRATGRPIDDPPTQIQQIDIQRPWRIPAKQPTPGTTLILLKQFNSLTRRMTAICCDNAVEVVGLPDGPNSFCSIDRRHTNLAETLVRQVLEARPERPMGRAPVPVDICTQRNNRHISLNSGQLFLGFGRYTSAIATPISLASPASPFVGSPCALI